MDRATTFIRALSLGSIFSLLLFTAACQTAGTIEEMAVTTPLPEISAPPEYSDGYRANFMADGEQTSMLLLSQTDTTETWKSGRGCSWTRLKTGFAPNIQWSGCEGADGTQEVELIKGRPYPLRVGNTWRYSLSGKNVRGNIWDGTDRCEVTDTVRITTASGEHDTFKVVCTDPWSTRTWHVSPELNLTVRYVRNHKSRGTIVWEFVKVVSEGGDT